MNRRAAAAAVSDKRQSADNAPAAEPNAAALFGGAKKSAKVEKSAEKSAPVVNEKNLEKPNTVGNEDAQKFDNIDAMSEAELIPNLERQVDLLCARCEALAREVRRLQTDNRKLRENAGRAKQKIRDIIARMPENAGERTH